MPKTYNYSLAIGCLGFMAILFFILLTNPQNLSASMLLILPIIVAITSYSISKFLLLVFVQLDSIKIKTISLVFALGPTLVVLLGSLGQLGFQDLLLAFLLVSGMGWYIKRIQKSTI